MNYEITKMKTRIIILYHSNNHEQSYLRLLEDDFAKLPISH